MNNKDIEKLKKEYESKKEEIKSRLEEFSNLDKEKYKYELFFCLLTPQSKAEKCWLAIQELKEQNFNESIIEPYLLKHTRFYRNKTRYLQEAIKQWPEIQKKIEEIENPIELRNFLVKNVKGLGLKEASHFLRNIGKSDNNLAILDRHILRNLEKMNIIPKSTLLNNRTYKEIEQAMIEFSNQIQIPLDELDLLFWSMETGKIFK